MTITNELQRLGLETPQPIRDTDAVRTAVLGASVYHQGDDTSTFTNQLRSRSLKPADAVAALTKLGLAIAARQGPRVAAPDVARALDQADAAALVAASGELHDALRPIVETEGRRLAEAVAVVGTEPDSKSMARMEPAAGSMWQQFAEATQRLDAARTIVQAIAAACGQRKPSPLTWVDLAHIKTATDVERATATFGNPVFVVNAGFTLTLNDDDAIAATLGKITDARQRAEAAQRAVTDRANADDGRRPWKPKWPGRAPGVVEASSFRKG